MALAMSRGERLLEEHLFTWHCLRSTIKGYPSRVSAPRLKGNLGKKIGKYTELPGKERKT